MVDYQNSWTCCQWVRFKKKNSMKVVSFFKHVWKNKSRSINLFLIKFDFSFLDWLEEILDLKIYLLRFLKCFWVVFKYK